MLARYGYSVTVVESHYLAGGAAHSFDVKAKSGGVYKFGACALFLRVFSSLDAIQLNFHI
jgi:phytoene dehydrogenase-like protein